MEITDRDINRVESIFFNGQGSFEDEQGERYAFIKCIDRSIDVEACPGSGKTTSLLAKLYLLSEKMSLESGKGICVLTHTNVAINEIKKRLGTNAYRLFQYPNFFGTIQSFIDKFLAIPYYSNKYKKRPVAIDTALVANRFQNSYLEYNLRDKVGKVKYFLKANNLYDKITFKRISNNSYSLVEGVNGPAIVIRKPRSSTDWTTQEKNEYFQVLYRLRKQIYSKNALLSYDDAYFVAQEYIFDLPKVKSVISNRFSYVFIDEMQDTYIHQNEIINQLFNENVILQRIGDPNQAILNDNKSVSAWEVSERLRISGSRRFSQPIANILKTVALKGDPNLSGNTNITIPPYILSYECGREPEVLEKFVTLIHSLELENVNEYPVKAVGWVGKKNDGITISNYFISYNKEISLKVVFNSLKSALLFCDKTKPGNIYEIIINCTLEILHLAGIKNNNNRYFNKTSLIEFINKSKPEVLNSFNAAIAIWVRKMNHSEDVMPEIRTYLLSFFQTLGYTLNDKAREFLNSDSLENINENGSELKNTYRSELAHLNHIAVEVGTVHSVKGETHKATLYLETFFHRPCHEYLIEQLIGIAYNGTGNPRKEMCLKIAHVAMSRPTHLLCVALNNSVVEQRSRQLIQNGWQII